MYPIVIVDEDPNDLAENARRDEGDVLAHVSVVGRNGGQCPMDPRHGDPNTEAQDQNAPGDKEHSPRRPIDRSEPGPNNSSAHRKMALKRDEYEI